MVNSLSEVEDKTGPKSKKDSKPDWKDLEEIDTLDIAELKKEIISLRQRNTQLEKLTYGTS